MRWSLIHGDTMWILHHKLTRLSHDLRLWSRAKVGNISLSVAAAEQIILGLDQDLRDFTISRAWSSRLSMHQTFSVGCQVNYG